MTDKEITIAQEAVDFFLKEYEKALKNPLVRNPVSHAGYKIYRYYDKKEYRRNARDKD